MSIIVAEFNKIDVTVDNTGQEITVTVDQDISSIIEILNPQQTNVNIQEPGAQGIQGPAGPQGPVGPTGPAGGVNSFNSRTGPVVPQAGDYTKSDVGLGNVDNTSDLNKPVSTATQTALNLKENSSNKTTNFTGNTGSNTLFATVKATFDAIVGYLSAYQPLIGYTPVNDQLSNLAGTSINTDLNPDSDEAYKIGSAGQNFLTVNTTNVQWDDAPTIDVKQRKLIDSGNLESVDFESRTLKDSGEITSVDWLNRTLNDDSALKTVDFLERRLYALDGTTIVTDFSAVTGPTTITQPINNNSTRIATTEYVDRLGPKFDPQNFVRFFDDFIGATAASAFGWNVTNSGTGSINVSSVGGTTSIGALGVYSFSTGSTATGRSCNFAGQQALIFGQGAINYKWRIRLAALSDGANTYTVYIGLGDNTAAGDMIDGVYFQYSNTLNGGDWTLSTSNNSTRTTLDSNIPAVANAWVNLECRINAAGTSAQFFVNGVSGGTIATNIPTASGRESGPLAKIQKSVGATSSTLFLDYFYMDFTPTTLR